MNPVRLGILGAGRITARIMTDLHNAHRIELKAVAARDPERAKEAAARYGAPIACSYKQLAERDDVDLVYIATPHPLHCEQAVLMMEHGKHILCEKPMTMNDHQAQLMIDCARKNNVFLMEAMWTRFMPAMQEAIVLIRAGAIGEIRHITAEFSYYHPTRDLNDRLWNPALAGGALLDLGVYPLMAITSILGWHPETVQSLASLTPEGVDMRTSVQMQYPSGATAHLMCGMDATGNNRMTVYGTRGMIDMPGFWHPISFTLCPNGAPAKEYTFAP